MIIDLHYHTCVPGPLRPRELLEYDRRNGLVYTSRLRGVDAICLTEHDKVWEKDAVRALTEQHGLLVLRGMEVSTNYAEFGHVLVYGLSRYISGIWDIKKLAHVVEQEGGAMFAAHPFREVYSWGGEGWIAALTVQEASEMPIFQVVHGIEVFNGATQANANEFAMQVCRNLGLLGTAGSDAHSTVGVGACATVFDNPITSEEDLVRELRAGNFQPAIRKDGSFAVSVTA
ncbi:MAG: PHP domain-containing protein [Dehalococcoidia bacterium]|nr:PHP domain-containing protein [Dehalococcoidia bacterium]